MRTTEHLMFAALMVPTFLLLTAAAVSLGYPEPKAAKAAPAATAAHATLTAEAGPL